MTEEKNIEEQEENMPRQSGLLFELDNLPLKGREILMDIIKGLFADKDARYFSCSPHAAV